MRTGCPESTVRTGSPKREGRESEITSWERLDLAWPQRIREK